MRDGGLKNFWLSGFFSWYTYSHKKHSIAKRLLLCFKVSLICFRSVDQLDILWPSFSRLNFNTDYWINIKSFFFYKKLSYIYSIHFLYPILWHLEIDVNGFKKSSAVFKYLKKYIDCNVLYLLHYNSENDNKKVKILLNEHFSSGSF